MPEAINSLLPSGAGRFLDYTWPDPLQAPGVNINANIRGRVGGYTIVNVAPGNIFALGGGVGGNVANVLLGVPCVQIVSTVAAGGQWAFYPGFHMPLRTSRSAIGAFADDTFVYRYVVNMCGFGATVAAGHDYGFEVVRWTGAAATLAGTGADGFGIRIQDPNTVQLLVHGPNGLVVTNLTVAPFDTTQWHTYDFRIFNAGPSSDAQLTLRIDGGLVPLSAQNSNWAAPGTNLPAAAVTGNFMSFVPTIVSNAGVNVNLFINQCRMIAAPTELMTL